MASFVKKHYVNDEGLKASIYYEKFSSVPHMDITKTINAEKCLSTVIYSNVYSSEANAIKAVNAWAKRNGYSRFYRI